MKSLRLSLLLGLASLTSLGASSYYAGHNNSTTDDNGYHWNFNNYGALGQHNNNFGNALMLYIGDTNSNFSTSQISMDGPFRLHSGQIGAIGIERRILLDPKISVGYWLDTLRNDSAKAVKTRLFYQIALNNHTSGIYTDQGRPMPFRLMENESAFMIGNQQLGRPDAIITCGSRQSPLKPSISYQSSNHFHITYEIEIPPQSRVSLIHSLRQFSYKQFPTGLTYKKLFREARPDKVLNAIPLALRSNILNLRGKTSERTSDRYRMLLRSHQLADASEDTLIFNGRSSLRGEVRLPDFELDTKLGKASLSHDKIGAIGHRGDRQLTVYLRNGELISGTTPEPIKLQFKTLYGMTLSLDFDAFEKLILKPDAEGERQESESIAGYLITSKGESLSLGAQEEMALEWALPYGTMRVPLDEVESIAPLENPLYGYNIELTDGSRYRGFLLNKGLDFVTRTFGNIHVSADELFSYKRGSLFKSGRGTGLQLSLSGNYQLSGRINHDELTFRLGTTDIPVPPDQIRSLINLNPDPDQGRPGQTDFIVTLWSGDQFEARLTQTWLKLNRENDELRLPTNELIELKSPAPILSVDLLGEVNDLIEQLGHQDWQTRELATRKLESFGEMIERKLKQSRDLNPDPEVRRRIDIILNNLE